MKTSTKTRHWSCNIRKKLQEALESTDKILAAGFVDFQVSLHFQQKGR